MTDIAWGSTGETVYERTYARTKLDGTKETWPETVQRVVDGNLGLITGRGDLLLPDERGDLIRLMTEFKIIPGGRHLWMSGVPGRQFLFNCHVAGWTDKVEDHFSFTFLRLMEGGGVGANYSRMKTYDINTKVQVYVVCDPSHPDYDKMLEAGVLTDEFDSDWTGSIDVEDSREGWNEALRDLFRAASGRTKHPKRVYDVSRVRWSGARIKSFGGTASGPLPLARMLLNVGKILSNRFKESGAIYQHDPLTFNAYLTPIDAMEIDHEIATCVVSGGVRRSARMSILHWADPYIGEFLTCKQDTGKHWTTNISVEIDDEFIEALKVMFETEGADDAAFAAADVYRAIVEGMLTNGEPGIWNSSLSNVDEPNEVEATNPCLTGDTVIATLNGPRTFADLAEAGEDVEVYSWHPKTKTPVVRWMRTPHRTGKNVEVVRVKFDSGLVVRCTPNHKFFTFRGKKIEAKDLTIGQSIRAFSASRDASGHERVHGWDSKKNGANHQWTHRMIWENAYGPIPEGMVIAHLDHDARNNQLSNLKMMTPYEHASYDYPLRAEAGFNGQCYNHKVISVEPDGTDDVYNGMVEDSHSYVILDPDPVAGHMSGIISANCGEITLEAWENCNLGHVNLDAFADEVRSGRLDPEGLLYAHRLMTRFLIRATYGDIQDPKQRSVVDRNRRIGVGHFGYAGFVAKQGIPYSESHQKESLIPLMLNAMSKAVREEARTYAYELRIPEPVKVTTVAPTGTIAKMPGRTEGIHPVYAKYFIRRIRFSTLHQQEAEQAIRLMDAGYRWDYDLSAPNTVVIDIPTKESLVDEVTALGFDGDRIVESVDDISIHDMLAVQAMYQTYYADNAVSFTINVPQDRYSVSEVMEALLPWLPQLKGTTIFPDKSRPQAPYQRISREAYESSNGTAIDSSFDDECTGNSCPVR